MVEGPGATRNGRKVQAVVGLVLTEIASHHPSNRTKENGGCSKKRIVLEGRVLESTFSVGKEVFLVLGPISSPIRDGTEYQNDRQEPSESDGKPIALRLHFGMNGMLVVRKFGESSKLAPWRKNDKSVQEYTLKFARTRPGSTGNTESLIAANTKDTDYAITSVVEVVSSTCTIVSAFVARSKFYRLHRMDVCGSSTNFDPEAVLTAVLEKRGTAMVCDALLDQERYPGVGNIIKIEGVHKARVHPRRLVRQLSREELQRVILECRDYAIGWLSSGRAPTKHVYNRSKCGTCKTGRVRMEKLGKYLSRVTFWCENCQPFALPAATSTKTPPSSTASSPCTLHQGIPNNSGRIFSTPLLSSCPQHGSKTILLRRSRKVGSSNIYRLFRSCKVQGCQFFAWADSHLPSCYCPHKKAILRVSKTERTGGRWFLSCATAASHRGSRSSSKTPNNSCSFFQWATPSQLAPFGDNLSPLT